MPHGTGNRNATESRFPCQAMSRIARLFLLAWLVSRVPIAAAEIAPEHQTDGTHESTVVTLRGRPFRVAPGFRLELAVSPDLVPRPINACFDWAGNLYVTDSSGSNDPVKQQLQEKPHRILRLTDRDGDGRFDHRTVFADKMMFPEGILWHEGTIYVSAPPQIWALRDEDEDGVAEHREIWFDGKTLTGCANDLHGPYLGRDGWIYWCKGAFAEQTHQLVDGRSFTTRAAHIFRRRPEGGPIDVVMTGGMDNPVAVVMNRTGDRFFTTTFLQHPGQGNRDGILHVIDGGLYGKRHSVLEGHPKTGLDLMPVMTHLGPAAPSGLLCLRGGNDPWRGSLVSACFNLHQVQHHTLIATGATFTTQDQTLVESDHLDFHPTDVVEDADGSVLIVDTGGWYKLCCPSSQLHKPDELGGIYRLVPKKAEADPDPRGFKLPWEQVETQELCERLRDDRWFVRERSLAALGDKEDAVQVITAQFQGTTDSHYQQQLLWALARCSVAPSTSFLTAAIADRETSVRRVAMHLASLARDDRLSDALIESLSDEDVSIQRSALEALGRLPLESRESRQTLVRRLLAMLGDEPNDAILQHCLTYTLLRHVDAKTIRIDATHDSPTKIKSLLMIQQQRAPQAIVWHALGVALVHRDDDVREVAAWVVEQHGDRWNEELVQLFLSHSDEYQEEPQRLQRLIGALGTRISAEAVRAPLVRWLETNANAAVALQLVKAFGNDWPQEVRDIGAERLAGKQRDVWLQLMNDVQPQLSGGDLQRRLLALAESADELPKDRLLAAHALSATNRKLSDATIRWLVEQIEASDGSASRGMAARSLRGVPLNKTQLRWVIETLPSLGLIELREVMELLRQGRDTEVGMAAIEAWQKSVVTPTIPDAETQACFAGYPDAVQTRLKQSLAAAKQQRMARIAALPQRLAELPEGDIRRGQQVFHSKKTACFSCHQMGYRGGEIGPDLTRIGRIRSRAELFEAITMPSASLVRSYESVTFETTDGKTFQGVVQDETNLSVRIVGTDRREIELPLSDIETRYPSHTSIMPTGLDETLSDQELADLLSFLEAAK